MKESKKETENYDDGSIGAGDINYKPAKGKGRVVDPRVDKNEGPAGELAYHKSEGGGRMGDKIVPDIEEKSVGPMYEVSYHMDKTPMGPTLEALTKKVEHAIKPESPASYEDKDEREYEKRSEQE